MALGVGIGAQRRWDTPRNPAQAQRRAGTHWEAPTAASTDPRPEGDRPAPQEPLATPAASLLPWRASEPVVKFLCDQCQAKYQIADEKAAGKTVRMKCRKCGHLIEVRATVVDGSDAMSIPPPGQRPTVGRPSQKPPPPRHAPLATSLASAKAPPRTSDKPGALASAFRSNVQRDDEVSAPVDMSDLSAADEWYVAINGVPVGPIRIAEVRRKAAIGAVTEESLCWQEGLDEWRPLRSFPELALIVREAAASGRSSLP